jgi:hypothetical protein
MERKRVLYSDKGTELSVVIDRVNERIVFTAPNDTGFTGETLKDIERDVNSTIVASRQFLTYLEKFKDIVHERSPALLGYEGYISSKERKKIAEEEKVGTTFVLPLAAIIETGNHITQIKKGDRYTPAQKLVDLIEKVADETTPWASFALSTGQKLEKQAGKGFDRS